MVKIEDEWIVKTGKYKYIIMVLYHTPCIEGYTRSVAGLLKDSDTTDFPPACYQCNTKPPIEVINKIKFIYANHY